MMCMGKYTVSDVEMQDCIKQIKAILHIEDDNPNFLGELKDAAQEVWRDNPGITFEEWRHTLIEQYPAEIVDALGIDEKEVDSQLFLLWKEINVNKAF